MKINISQKFLLLIFIILIILGLFNLLKPVPRLPNIPKWNLSGLSGIAQSIYEKENSYKNFNCNYKKSILVGDPPSYQEISICDGIEKFSGYEPVIHANDKEYCAYFYNKSVEEGIGYYCVSDKNYPKLTYINPDQRGYCDGKTFLCPTEIGEMSLEEKIRSVIFSPITLPILLIGIGLGGIVVLLLRKSKKLFR